MSFGQALLVRCHPKNWNWKTYLWIGIFLLVVNFLGPRGLIHWIVIHQQRERLTRMNEQTTQQIKDLELEISDFKKFDYKQQKSIREELGYLKEDEWSLEFVEAKPENSPKSP